MARSTATRKTSRAALAFVRKHGAVLLSARGVVPSLVEWAAGEKVRGSWWAHPRGREIYALVSAVSDSPDVLVCRLIDGKLTLVHRRLWTALLRAAASFARSRLARVIEEHTPQGRHRTSEVPCPDWAPREVRTAADALTREDALAELEAAGVVP